MPNTPPPNPDHVLMRVEAGKAYEVTGRILMGRRPSARDRRRPPAWWPTGPLTIDHVSRSWSNIAKAVLGADSAPRYALRALDEEAAYWGRGA